MITRIGMAPRRPGLDIQRFQSHWSGKHAELVSKLPGVRRYWQNHAVLRDGEPLLPWIGFDACSDMEFDDMLSMDSDFASLQYREAVKDDEAYLVEKTKGGLILGDREHKSGEIDGNGIRLLTFMRLAPQREADELHQALRAMPTPTQAKGHELFLALHGRAAAQRTSIFDAVGSLWFESEKDALSYLTSAEARESRHVFADLVRGTEHLIARVVIIA